jgi:eukaryotic-like serine/threonine-protein kinase
MPTDDRDPLDVLAEEFVERIRRGEHPSVSAYAAEHPEHAGELRELLPAVAQMEMLKRFRHPAAETPLPDRLGDFRIVRELGRGGMGVVFEAVQESLGRPVALKVLARHAQLDPTRRNRFVREAQAAAKLHHTNIVPVFGVGEQDGLPYYVMQLIPGCGLHAVVAQWRARAGITAAPNRDTRKKALRTEPDAASGPTTAEPEVRAPDYGDWRFVADVGLQTANALHYAHKQGVLHRDVKPANLILDGETVWVTDFGLAKLLNAEGLTATGDILGTLQYLPPECLHGAADARSDVYGLGATLYELLTLEPPYAADSPGRLIKQVADADPPPPRELNPDIPRDLETIVLKAMSREPRGRYASARALAEDLEAFLEDRPIKARRTALVSRAWRWCRRNPAVASLALSTVVALSLAAVAGWVGYARTTAALAGEEDRRREAEREQHKAERATALAQQKSDQLEENLELSLKTFERVFEAASGTGRQGFGVPLMPPRGGGPGGAFTFGGPGGPDGPKKDGPGFEGPGGKKDGPPPKRDGPGGPGGPAAESASDKTAILDAVLNFYDKFAQQKAPSARVQFEAAKASRRVCEAHTWLKRPEKAVIAFNRAVGLLGPLVEQNPTNDAMRTELVLTYLSAPPEAFPGDRQEPLRLAAELARGNVWLTGTVQFRAGWAREQFGDRAGAEAAYRAAADTLSTARQSAAPNAPTHAHLELAFARLRLAGVQTDQGKLAPARKVLEESIEDLHPLVPERAEGPPRPEREWLVMTYWALSDVCKRQKDDRGADQALANAGRYGGFGFGPPGGPGGPGGKKDDRFGPGGPGGKKEPPPKKGPK